MVRLQRIGSNNGRFLICRWQHFKLGRCPRFHLFSIRCVNTEHAVNAEVLPVDRQPVLLGHAPWIRRADAYLDTAISIVPSCGGREVSSLPLCQGLLENKILAAYLSSLLELLKAVISMVCRRHGRFSSRRRVSLVPRTCRLACWNNRDS
jgi:hypothetical protein